MDITHESEKSIAIIGMGFRLPGGISTDGEFWDLLINKKNGRCKVPLTRYNVDGFGGGKTQTQSVATEYGYFLQSKLSGVDTSFFSMKHAEVNVLDPQLRLLLEVAWECMESAGQTHKLVGSNTGVFAGVFGEDWHNMLHRDDLMPNTYRVLSAGDYGLSNVLSYQYDFRGPSMTIRTACSSSLSGLHIACQSLRNGDCSTALVVGSSLIMDPSMTLDMSGQGVLASDGRCKTFDAAADGFARGEATNAVLLKPLEAAMRDGDPIRAVIRSTAINSDGQTQHVGTPSAEAQISMIDRAYQLAGISDRSMTPFVECHGTGTMKGDPIETTAVGKAFGNRGTYIGSVKPNLGHGEGAAALTSVIKCVLALENKVIPPNINFETPNPNILFQKYNLQVPVDPIPWPADRRERISVSAFGFGGANGHVILDSAASFGIGYCATSEDGGSSDANSLNEIVADSGDSLNASLSTGPSSKTSDCDSVSPKEFPRLILLSARSEKSLKERVSLFKDYVPSSTASIDDIAYTLGMRVAHLSHRAFAIYHNSKATESPEFSIAKKAISSKDQDKKIAYVFTGQGAQWFGMGKELVRSSASFLEDVKNMDRVLRELATVPDWTLEDLLYSEDNGADKEYFDSAEFAQPLCTAIQIGLVNFLSNCGIKPSAVVGHSSGEIAAAYAAGGITYSEAILCAYFRGLATTKLKTPGSMASVGLGRDRVASHLVDGVQIAFHMRTIAAEYEQMLKPHLAGCKDGKDWKCPFYSSVHGKLVDSPIELGPLYWKSNLSCPVLFYSAARQLLSDLPEVSTLLEIGPHPALQGPARQILESESRSSMTYLGTLARGKPADDAILTTLGQLHTIGHGIDFSFILAAGTVVTDLPRYSWDRKDDLWKESRLSKGWRMRQFPHHELLGTRCAAPSGFDATWRNVFHVYDVSWLKDHMLGTDVVFPVAGYVAMIGEAIRQLLGSEAYVLENLIAKAALMVPDADTVEVMTTMRPFRLSGLTNSSTLYEFSICSFMADTWVEHCTALGKAAKYSEDADHVRNKIVPLQRQLHENYFYDRLNYIGFSYGPRFRALRKLTTATHEQHAVATITDTTDKEEAVYTLHPITIDCAIQLIGLAACRGIGRKIDTLAVPVQLNHITVRPGQRELLLDAMSDTAGGGTGKAFAISKDTGKTVLELLGGRVLPFHSGHLQNKENMHAARIEWLPDLDFYDNIDFVRTNGNGRMSRRLLHRATAIIVDRMLHELELLGIDAAETPGTLPAYINWLKNERSTYMQDGEFRHLTSKTCQEKSQILDSLFEELAGDDETKHAVANMYRRLADCENIRAIFTSKVSALEICLQDKGLESLYNYSLSLVSPNDYLALLAHSKPTMSVLEIGAGSGAATEVVLRGLMAEDGTRLYSQYVFSDVSSGYFVKAKDRFAEWDAIQYKVLDIGSEPSSQGFDLQSFDLIIASNVLHATPSLQRSLMHIRSLLKPGGRFVLQDLMAPVTWRNIPLLTGLLPGWWDDKEDTREEGPLVSVDRWHKELLAAGFSGTDVVKLDDDAPYTLAAHMASTAVAETKSPQELTFLYRQFRHDFARQLADKMELMGHEVHWVQLDSQENGTLPGSSGGRDIISTMELEGPFVDKISETDYRHFIRLVSQHGRGILWLTRPAQFGCTDPGYGASTGLMRCVRVEVGLECWIAETEALDGTSLDSVSRLARKFCQRTPMDRSLDSEYAIRQNGIVYVPRFRWLSTQTELQLLSGHEYPKQLVNGQHGSVDSLHWVSHQRTKELAPDQVQVDIRFAGLNFKDLLTTLGIVPGEKDVLGLECSGIIVAKGSAVHVLNVGDHVCTIGSGLIRTRQVFPTKAVMRIPKTITLEQAATLPVVYATAMHAIVNLGRLKKGQSILIHSAAGGVGQAAINICKAIGATIYVTAGTEEKVEFLMAEHEIPGRHIFDSRNDSFFNHVMDRTGGRGVDLVLNSLAGDLLQASWRCVAKSGQMLDIGKRDMLEHGRLAMDMFQSNRTYRGIDLSAMDEDGIIELMEQCSSPAFKESFQPIRPIRTFGLQQVSEALKYMQKGHHMGKLVVALPEEASQIPAVTSETSILFSDEATYLVVGGLGGLGKEVARWMVEKGARSLCFLSPSAASDKHATFIQELQSQGCRVTAIAGDVSKMDDVERAIAESPTLIGGVLQLSMVLKDRPLLEMSYQDWQAVQEPKVKGTWNLHNALLTNTKLDFFILMGSVAGLVGQPGQGNYASANSFLDSFCHYRQQLGLPCSVIDLGGMQGIGFLAGNASKISQFKSAGMFLLHEHHLMEAIEIGLHRSTPTKPTILPGVGGFTWTPQLAVGLGSLRSSSEPLNMRLFMGDVRFSKYVSLAAEAEQKERKRDEKLRELLEQIEHDPSVLYADDIVERASLEIGSALFEYLSLPEDEMNIHATLESIGVDSLVSIEIRNWWRRTLGLETTAVEIMKAGTIEGLGTLAVSSLKKKYGMGEDDCTVQSK
ncbi:hypothetical protein BB8028_0001g06890 [Beauveria bassiana]|uniref:Uncharacterized protein n=1 Tax=Beauveria bassiana TaxID=176275 RepID=A0A2S7XXK1_BEABA|nr:hypothetical protein BB8028_0001g06890 [Beauveria bassiana]